MRSGSLCGIPNWSRTASPNSSVMALVLTFNMVPLIMIALWKSPLAAGMHIRVPTFPPPPDSPNMVTLSGSPPKRLILSRTHSRALTASIMPTLPEYLYLGSPVAERSRNPMILRRWLRLTTTTSFLARPMPGFQADVPESNPPPWHQNITGFFPLVSVVHTLSTQQSSALPFWMRPPWSDCGPHWVQSRMVSHLSTGAGGMQRSALA